MTIFELLKQTQEQGKTEQKQVITYKADGNGVKLVNKHLVNLTTVYNSNNIISLYAEYSEGETGSNSVTIYRDFDPCWEVQTIYSDTETENFHVAAIRFCQGFRSYHDFEEMIENNIRNGYYIKNNALKLLEIKGSTDLLHRARQAKAEYFAEKERQDAEENATKAAEVKAQKQAEQEEKERLKTEKLAFLEGYADGKTQIQIERLYDILSKTEYYRSNGTVTRKTRKQFILDELNEGGRVEKKEGVITYYGSKWNRKQSKPKTEYRLYSTEGTFWKITKVEYDFALHLMQMAA